MEGEQKIIMLLFDLNYGYANERSCADVKAPCGLFPADPFQLDFTLSCRRGAEVIDDDFKMCRRCDQLNGIDANLREARTQNLMSGKNFIEGSFKYRNIQ